MSGRKAKEKRRQLRLIQGGGQQKGDPEPEELEADPRDRRLLEELSATIKRLPDDPAERTKGARLLIEVTEHPELAQSTFLQEFSGRYEALLRDMCKQLGYEGIYVADPQFGALRPGEAPKAAFQLYREPQKLIVFGEDEDR
jgi:hypothetical protein